MPLIYHIIFINAESGTKAKYILIFFRLTFFSTLKKEYKVT